MQVTRKNKRIHKRSRRAKKYKARGGQNNITHYHIYNIFHYGDNIFNLKFFFGIADILKQHNIIIHYYYDPIYIRNVDELTRYVNPEVVILDTLDKKPNDAYVMWMGNYDNWNIEPAISSMYKDVLKHLRLENLQINTSIYQKEDYLLDIYNKLDPKFKGINILILNAEPKSAQFSYNKEKMDNMCRRLASKFKVVVISPVDNIPSTLTDGLKLQDIGAISTHAEYIIGFNSGPLIPCFNIHTKNKVKKWIIFDQVGTIIKEVNAILLSKEENINRLNAKDIQVGGNKYTHKTKKQKKIHNKYNIFHIGKGMNFIFCLLGGGLGNQLFKYAKGLVLKNILKIPLLLFNVNDNPHSSVDYRVFFKRGESKDKKEFEQRINNAEKLASINGYNEKPYLAKIPEYKMKDVKIQNEYDHIYNLIKDVIPIIKVDFISELKLKYPEFEKTILNDITRENLAFMHVRKGDYNAISWSSSANYFTSALNIIDTIPEIKIIYILSNNIKYCKEQIDSKLWKSTKEIKIFDEIDELKCMYLMSLCNGGGILSASTFSWWGVMFGANDNPNSVILYPDNIKYKKEAILTYPDQIGNKWKAVSDTKGAKLAYITIK